ncbi:MAG: hypothetical protein IKH75_11730 [Ruminococcus sp.]|nr:hypothetical protein [Ruminococcus sp.]
MAKIDTSKIEGYADMTPEQKVAALESYAIADPDYSGYIKKDVFDKTASELAQTKKDLKARMTEEEKQKAEAEAELKKYKEQAETLQREKNIADNKAKFISIGYDDTLATETAEALEKGDYATLFKNHQTVIENVKKIAKGEAMASTTPPAGKANEGGKTITKEQFDNMTYTERVKLFETNPDLYKELTK